MNKVIAKLNEVAALVRKHKKLSVYELSVMLKCSVSAARAYAKQAEILFEDITYMDGCLTHDESMQSK